MVGLLNLVGDAIMGPRNHLPGGSVEHWNEEAESRFVATLTNHFEKVAWLNPQHKAIGLLSFYRFNR